MTLESIDRSPIVTHVLNFRRQGSNWILSITVILVFASTSIAQPCGMWSGPLSVEPTGCTPPRFHVSGRGQFSTCCGGCQTGCWPYVIVKNLTTGYQTSAQVGGCGGCNCQYHWTFNATGPNFHVGDEVMFLRANRCGSTPPSPCEGSGPIVIVPPSDDSDSDGDGTPDCVDGCPFDPLKTEPGACGCGEADIDSDDDGVLDCDDGCPQDPLKVEPGVCGCGNPDVDTDGDGVLDCNDGCPDDPDQSTPGPCGCGSPGTGLEYIPISLESIVNSPLQVCFTPQSAISTLGGVPFAIPLSGYQQWRGSVAASGCQTATAVIPVDIHGVTAVYTLINTNWGGCGESLTTIRAIGSDGDIFEKTFTNGIEIRDYLNTIWCNSTNDPNTEAVYVDQPGGGCGNFENRMDMQRIQLPVAFSHQILSEIVVTDAGCNGSHRAHLNGLTVTVATFPDGCNGDLNGDGQVNVIDLLTLLAAWGQCAIPEDCPVDLNGDGEVGVAELLVLVSNWGTVL